MNDNLVQTKKLPPPSPSPGTKPASWPPPKTSVSVESAEVPTFTVVALGNAACGKTVFLTVAARKLAATRADRKFYLELDDLAQKERLDANYLDLVTADEWPQATRHGSIETFRFRCMVDTDAPRHVFNIDYIDYAGEYIDAQVVGSPVEDQLQAHIRNANALFCMLDGTSLRGWLRGEGDGTNYIEFGTQRLLEIVRRSECPVHILVTKWDGFGSTLSQAFKKDRGQLALLRCALLERPEFGQLRDQAVNKSGTLRIIPVSATGDRFARIRNGRMVKLKNASLDPEFIDLPFCAVVADFLNVIEKDLKPSDRVAFRYLRRAPQLLGQVLSATVKRKFRSLSNENALVGGILDVFGDAMRARPGAQSRTSAQKDSPVTLLVSNMVKMLEEFESRMPASVLGRYRAEHAG